MSYLRDTAIVLKRESFREEDDRLTLYGLNHGKLEAVARASRRLSTKSLGHLDPLMEGEVMIAKGKAFDKLAVARVSRPRLRLRRHLSFLIIGSALSRMVAEHTKPGVPDSDLFLLLREFLDVAEIYPHPLSRERSRFLYALCVLKMMDVLGYAPAPEEVRRALPPDAARACAFVRREPLATALQITAPTNLFVAISSFIEEKSKQVFFETEPDPSARVMAFL